MENIALVMLVGKWTVQAVAVSKTCISTYKKGRSVINWWSGNEKQLGVLGIDQQPCSVLVIDMNSSDDDEGFILV